MEAKESEAAPQRARLPEPCDGVQVNVCRNPSCPGFGIEPSLRSTRGRPAADDGYRVIGAGTHLLSALTCKRCNESGTIKSNAAVVEETTRLHRLAFPTSDVSCSTLSCENHGRDIRSYPTGYQRFGRTPAGSVRFRCKSCSSTFSQAQRATHRLRQPANTEIIARLLINKSPMRRICEVAGVHAMTLYQRIRLIAKHSARFASDFERSLLDGRQFPRLHISCDRQDYVFNWGSHLDRRNVVLRSIVSAEDRTGYVFAANLNFDAGLDPHETELHARELEDPDKAPQFRHYARVWVPYEYAAKSSSAGVVREVRDTKMPSQGMQVHDDYAMYGHFYYVQRLLKGVERLTVSLDRDDGSRAACLAAFRDWVKEDRLYAFFVHIDKHLTIDKKKMRLAQSEHELGRARQRHPDLSDVDLALALIRERHAQALATKERWRDRWIAHPLPNMNEPAKALCCLTDTGRLDPERLARAYLRASLNAVDRFFMQLRRRHSLLERPIASASSAKRMWHGYSGYNPAVAADLIASFRVFYNFTLAGRDKKTPAMRLGLTDRVWTLGEVLGTASPRKARKRR